MAALTVSLANRVAAVAALDLKEAVRRQWPTVPLVVPQVLEARDRAGVG